MTIASKLETINEALGDIKSSIVAKGVTPSGNITTYSTAIESISTGDEITATNTTGSAVSADDRVWVNGEDVYTQNFTAYGNPTITNKTLFLQNNSQWINEDLTGFSLSNIDSIELFCKISFSSINTSSGAYVPLFMIRSQNNKIIYSGIRIFNNTYSIASELENTSIYASSGSFVGFELNKYVYIKTVIHSDYFEAFASFNGIDYISIGQQSYSQSSEIYDKVSISGSAYTAYSADLSECYIKVDGQTVWTPYTTSTIYSIINDTDITSTSFTGIAQEAIANNASGSVKTLLDGNGTYAPTTATKSITTNGTYTASAENAYGLSSVTVNVPSPDVWHNWKTDVLTDVSAGTLGSSYNRVIYGNGVYVATPLNGSTFSYSSNGTTWNSVTLPTSATNIRDGVYGNEFVVITDSGTCFISTDGTTWTQSQISSAVTSGWGSIAFGNGKYIAIKNDGLSINAAISSDGVTWADITLPANKWWQKIAYGNGVFVVCCGAYFSEQNTIAYSTDGNTWNTVNLPYNASWTLLTYGDSQGFMVFGDNRGTKYAYKSVDGITWTQISNPGFYTDDFNVTYGNGFYVGSIGSVFYYSQDGNNWSTFNAISRPGAIAFDGTNFITGVYNTNYSNGNIFYLGEKECYTLTASPITSTQVYEIPKKTSALTITAVGTGTITLSDSKVYNRNSAGDVQSPVLGTKTITSNNTYTAASDYLDGFSSVTVDVPSAPTKKYNLLDRVKDDSNNEIGTVSGFFTDANNVEYAVVCLDAQYRLASGQWCSDNQTAVTDLPIYSTAQWGPWEAKETATFNTQKILDYCTSSGATSTACSHCRSKSFTIDGTIYYGQLPNMIEMNDIVRNHTALNTADPTAGSYSSVNFSTGRTRWSSSQYTSNNAWFASSYGNMYNDVKTYSYGVVPVLEIPNT